VATYNVKTTIAAITSKESEVIAFHINFLCQVVGYKIGRKMVRTPAGCNEKARQSLQDLKPGRDASARPVFKRIPR
jgi:hypothetical protein